MSLQKLIERLEKAAGPDRELDLDIFLALDEFRVPFKTSYMVWVSHDKSKPVPLFTESIDAAVTLVPHGRDWETLTLVTEGAIRTECFVYPKPWSLCGDHERLYGEAPTPAISVCIAALKARAAVIPIAERVA